MAATLTPTARRGYGLGSVATGSFGTVPGLLLLPYLTDRLGIAAGLAGLIVFLPKAWDVVLNPIAQPQRSAQRSAEVGVPGTSGFMPSSALIGPLLPSA